MSVSKAKLKRSVFRVSSEWMNEEDIEIEGLEWAFQFAWEMLLLLPTEGEMPFLIKNTTKEWSSRVKARFFFY